MPYLSALSALLGCATWRLTHSLVAFNPGGGYQLLPNPGRIVDLLVLYWLRFAHTSNSHSVHCRYFLLLKQNDHNRHEASKATSQRDYYDPGNLVLRVIYALTAKSENGVVSKAWASGQSSCGGMEEIVKNRASARCVDDCAAYGGVCTTTHAILHPCGGKRAEY